MNVSGGNYMNRTVKMGVYAKNGEENTFNYYSTLRAYDKLKFVNFVTDTLVDGNYNSVIRDMIFDISIVHIMTDVDVSNILESNDAINQIEDFLDETNIVDIVKANVPELIDELNEAVDLTIEYKTGIHKNPIGEALASLLNTIEKKVSGIDTKKMMEMAQVISGMSGEITPERMLEAYSKSDIFKQKYAQMIADKEQHNAKIDAINTSVNVNVKSNRKNNKKSTSVK